MYARLCCCGMRNLAPILFWSVELANDAIYDEEL